MIETEEKKLENLKDRNKNRKYSNRHKIRQDR